MRHPMYRPKRSVSHLWQGCVMVTIASSLYTLRTGFGDELVDWAGATYRRRTYSGDETCTTFTEHGLVMLMFEPHSSRSPVPSSGRPHDLSWYFTGMPEELRPIGERMAIQFFPNTYNTKKSIILTGAVWSEGNALRSRDRWPNLFWHGLAPVWLELSERSEVLRAVVDNYDLTTVQVQVLNDLYAAKMEKRNEAVIMSPSQLQALLDDRPSDLQEPLRSRMTGGRDDPAIAECRERLSHINIIVPL